MNAGRRRPGKRKSVPAKKSTPKADSPAVSSRRGASGSVSARSILAECVGAICLLEVTRHSLESREIDTLLECVRHTEWWRSRGDSAALRRTQQLGNAILTTGRQFFAHDGDADARIAEGLILAAARQCQEGQAALHARLVGGAEVIERLCRSREVRS